jgi:GH18 family chitinase
MPEADVSFKDAATVLFLHLLLQDFSNAVALLLHRNLKVLLSIGGFTYSQSGHFNFVTNPSFRATFVSSAVTIVEGSSSPHIIMPLS